MNNINETSISKLRSWIKQSLFIKISSIGLIIILLMIPNTLIMDLIHERNFSQQSVIKEVSDKWGQEQQIVGPVLTIPYRTFYENTEGKKNENIKYAHFLP